MAEWKDAIDQRPAADPCASTLGRRDVLKLGAGAVGAALAANGAAAQAPTPGSVRPPGQPRPHTASGYKNTANRLGHNGPMDDTSRTIVRFVSEFNESRLTDQLINAFNRTMIDSLAALISGFEEEPVRIAARVAQDAQPAPGRLKSTVFGYGISTTPELAAFANGVQVRMTDFNDNPHTSNIIPGILAVAEAVHATGLQTMTAIIIGYEVSRVGAGESIAPALAAGKLFGLDEDRLANALTMALTPHVALNKGEGALSMWKGVRSAEATKCGIWAAMLARAGMTGPPQPFEGPGALWSREGRKVVKLPVEEKMAIELNWFKARPAEASSQGTLTLIPEMRAWTKPEEIASIQYDMNELGEISDAPKFDPRNRETADHSMPYILARALLDGDIYGLVHRSEVHGPGGAIAHGQDDVRASAGMERSGPGTHHHSKDQRRRSDLGHLQGRSASDAEGISAVDRRADRREVRPGLHVSEDRRGTPRSHPKDMGQPARCQGYRGRDSDCGDLWPTQTTVGRANRAGRFWRCTNSPPR
jgi:2-methylcitrate dehydratase